jgi:hypothetical protein
LIHDISSDPYFMPSKHSEMTSKYKGRERRQDHEKKQSAINFYSQSQSRFKSIDPDAGYDLNGPCDSDTPKHLIEKARIEGFLQKRRENSIDFQSIDA